MNISDFKLGMAFQRYLVEAQIPADARVLFTTLPDTTMYGQRCVNVSRWPLGLTERVVDRVALHEVELAPIDQDDDGAVIWMGYSEKLNTVVIGR